MDTQFKTSFIPKAPIAQPKSAGGGIGFLTLLSIIVFFVAVGLGAWVFLEKKILAQQIASEQAGITSNKTGIVADAATIENIIDLNNRINAGGTLLSKHVAITPIFAFLQKVTDVDVRFTNFSFSSGGKDASGNPTVQIELSGVGRGWTSVASQEDEFGKPDWKNVISNPKLSSFSYNAADGSVSFSFSATVNPSYLSYANTVAAAAAPQGQ
ncbi:MAG: hypothetical protein KGH93_00280 [Patescibacteria group bacterium]|nr:hypothetical protein [Patescibacteria group bacterium]MDE1945630.1 hypothetical protein [Patescibacteria group bacterium]